MSHYPTLAIAMLLAASLHGQGAGAAQSSPPPHDHQLTARGDHAMGFDQTKTTHHFVLYDNGGSIEVTAKDAKDKASITAIRAHLPHVMKMFAAGDFSTPMYVHAQDVPGTAGMQRLRDRIAYQYDDMPAGGRLRITTRHVRALQAVHEFLKFQIADHKTGDSLEVRRSQ